MKLYCVVYRVCGIYYRYRCSAKTKAQARKFCKEDLNLTSNDIVEAEEER